MLMGKNGFKDVKKHFEINLSVMKYKKTFDKLFWNNTK